MYFLHKLKKRREMFKAMHQRALALGNMFRVQPGSMGWVQKEKARMLRNAELIRQYWASGGNPLLNCMGTEGEQLRYGPIKALDCAALLPCPIGASEVIKWASGRFVKTDGSGRVEIAGSGDTEIIGWLEHSEETASATEGATVGTLYPANACPVIFRVPIANSGNYTAAMRYDTCDLLVETNVQGADLTSTEDVLVIVDGDVDNDKFVDVMVNQSKVGVQGVS